MLEVAMAKEVIGTVNKIFGWRQILAEDALNNTIFRFYYPMIYTSEPASLFILFSIFLEAKYVVSAVDGGKCCHY